VGSKDVAYESEWWEVYAGPSSQLEEVVDVEQLVGKCHVHLMGASIMKPGKNAAGIVAPFPGLLTYLREMDIP
jgi:hypothetical protein